MPEVDKQIARIAVDDLVEAASTGVLRALEARKFGQEVIRRNNGFIVDIIIRCGGFPGPIDLGGRLGPGTTGGQ